MIYGAEGAAILSADIVFNVGANTYACKLDPTKKDHSTNALPVDEQPIWSIVLYENVTDADGNSRMNTLYPNGNTNYQFVANNYRNYTYKFRL